MTRQFPREKYLRQVLGDLSIYESNLADRSRLLPEDFSKWSDNEKNAWIRQKDEEIERSWNDYMKNERIAWKEYSSNYPELLGFTKQKMEGETKPLDSFEDGQVKNAEPLPAIFELTKEQVMNLGFETYAKDYNDGKGLKTRYILVVGEKKFFAPQIVLSMLKKAKSNPKLIRVMIAWSGSGLQKRYSVKEVEGI